MTFISFLVLGGLEEEMEATNEEFDSLVMQRS